MIVRIAGNIVTMSPEVEEVAKETWEVLESTQHALDDSAIHFYEGVIDFIGNLF